MNRRLMLCCLPLFAAACTSSTAADGAPAHPALWKVYDADTTVYLFGTIHLLPKGLSWTTPKMAKAIAASDDLVLETVIDKDPAKLGAAMRGLAVSPGLPPILDRVPPDRRAALTAMVAKAGLTLPYLDMLETWAVALALSSTGMAKLGAQHEEGVEPRLTQVFAAANKPVAGLETNAEQLGYFDKLSESAQREFLLTVIDDDDAKAKAEFDAMVDAWKAGNVRKIAVTFDDEMKKSPELAEALLAQRNAKWADWVAQRLASPGTVFVAVGAGHLAGKGSVEDLLAAKGVKVVRVQ